MPQHNNSETADVLDRLHRSGWSVGETAFATEAGGLVWVVDGRNGENRIRAEGAAQKKAWARALEKAREVGMLETGGTFVDRNGS